MGGTKYEDHVVGYKCLNNVILLAKTMPFGNHMNFSLKSISWMPLWC